MKEKQSSLNSEAVSPVIGVMLMLVVTIIVAAAVSAFAGGFADDQKETPVAQIDVQLKTEGSYPKLVFTHLGGDALDTGDLKIITYFHGYGKCGAHELSKEVLPVRKHTTDGSLDPMVPANNYDAADYNAGTGSFISNNGYPCTVSNGKPVKYWGNSTMMPGDVYTTIDKASLESVITVRSVGDDLIEVEIIHIPSGKTIFSGEVIY
ncbi:type IV pilin N-terminal domain-containing protein [Methanofollis ethanolicus]|uniref:type IV pilin N-terminal domain-containing protein n=1 Tax=Methanofollis ethanolicus TaxID=488124 RepID=UPI001F474EEF|nr:type IV pilin N-terminal domain-containing protein [Methanofollis ethanolicus]